MQILDWDYQPFFIQLVLCPRYIRLFNRIESQTWWINSWIHHLNEWYTFDVCRYKIEESLSFKLRRRLLRLPGYTSWKRSTSCTQARVPLHSGVEEGVPHKSPFIRSPNILLRHFELPLDTMIRRLDTTIWTVFGGHYF